MKIFFSLLLLFSLPQAGAKFSRAVFDIPCNKITLQVRSCQQKTFPNEKVESYSLNGILLEGKILKDQPTKCQKNQKMNIKSWKALQVKFSNFFVRDGNCSTIENNKLDIIVTKQFCDTPGALSVPECFIQIISRQNKFNYAEQLDF